jgi:putative oxidoreductase
MTSTEITSSIETHSAPAEGAWRYVVPIGRALFALIFIMSVLSHFSSQTIEYARQQGVPWPEFLVPVSGILALVGGLSVLLGYRAKVGAGLLVIFLVPVTLMMHDFWTVEDPTMAMVQQVMFFKNVALLGAALILAYTGAGPVSLDARSNRSKHRA